MDMYIRYNLGLWYIFYSFFYVNFANEGDEWEADFNLQVFP